jgi:hypothetical protein
MSQLELVEAFTSGAMSRRRFVRGLTTLGMSALAAATYAASLAREPDKAFGAEAFVGYRCVVGSNVTYVATSAEAAAMAPYVCTELFTAVDPAAPPRGPQVVTPVTAAPTTTTVPVIATTAPTPTTTTTAPAVSPASDAPAPPRIPAAGLPVTL